MVALGVLFAAVQFTMTLLGYDLPEPVWWPRTSVEVLLHAALHCGMPNALNATFVARRLESQQRDVAKQESTHVDSALLKPEVELVGVEPQKVSPLQERDAALGDQPANVANGDAEMLRDLLDRDEGR
jgi:hypothetical protein